MNYLWLLLIPYCTLAFGIHGGEGITGINRQVRNLICALPFGLAGYYLLSPWFGLTMFIASYIGVNMGFDKFPLWFKGLITLPPIGAALLPLAYLIGYKTKWTNVLAEYLSGTFYGAALFLAVILFNGH